MSALAITKQDEQTIDALANLAAGFMAKQGVDVHEATRLAVAEFTKAHDRWLGLWQDRDAKDAFADRMWWKINGGEVPA